MSVQKPEVIAYYETMALIAETEKIKVQVRPEEMRGFIAAAKAMATAEQIIRVINEEEVRMIRMAAARDGLTVAEVRAAFARIRATAAPQTAMEARSFLTWRGSQPTAAACRLPTG